MPDGGFVIFVSHSPSGLHESLEDTHQEMHLLEDSGVLEHLPVSLGCQLGVPLWSGNDGLLKRTDQDANI